MQTCQRNGLPKKADSFRQNHQTPWSCWRKWVSSSSRWCLLGSLCNSARQTSLHPPKGSCHHQNPWQCWNYPLLQTITSAFTLSSLRSSWIKLVLQSATPVTWRTSWNQGKKVPWEKSHLTVSDGHLCANLLAFLHTSFPLPMPGQ